MTKLGIVTCSKVPELEESEQPLVPIFEQFNISVELVIWDDDEVNWTNFDALIIRSIWDYHVKHEAFLLWLQKLERMNVFVMNPISVIRNNIHKFYLQSLSKKGISIVPTIFQKKEEPFDYDELLLKDWDQVVIKPAISASAYHTGLFATTDKFNIIKSVTDIAAHSDILIQKFMPEIKSNGELSIIFFNKEYAYTILKKPTKDEFRIQSEFGGVSKRIELDQDIIDRVSRIVHMYPEDLLYARVDGLLIDGEFVLMELELTEPSLFLDYKDDAPEKFVNAFFQLLAS